MEPQEEQRKNQPGEDPRIPLEVRSYFARGRNALVARADFGSLYEDYYLHLLQHGIRHASESDELLKDALAAITLHLAARPRNEDCAWTIHIRQPLANLFVTGSNHRQTLTGRLFEPEGKRKDCNLFSSQVSSPGSDLRQSTIDFHAGDIFTGAETYYKRSEQRPARYFRIGPEEFVLIAAQPDCDLDWLGSLDNDAVAILDQDEELSLLERRFYLFDCGCGIERIYDLFLPYDSEALDSVFEGDPHLVIACPRCAARFEVTREALDDHLACNRNDADTE
jgi:molecular chaperone Hsp33